MLRITGVSWDELNQVLFFLTVTDMVHYGQTNRTAYDHMNRSSSLWQELINRDFSAIVEQMNLGSILGLDREALMTSDTLVDPNCGSSCDEMREYMCHWIRFYHCLPFERVMHRFVEDEYVMLKVLFLVPDFSLNEPVVDALVTKTLVIPTVGQFTRPVRDFLGLSMASRQTDKTDMVFQIWTSGPGRFQMERPQNISRLYYRGSHCMVVTVDSRDAWNEDTYSATQSCCSYYRSNSLSRALAVLKRAKPMFKLESSGVCQGVLIVGVGIWSQDAPISIQMFLKDCTQSFNIGLWSILNSLWTT